ncbi:MAG: AAA family ATPase, partial [Solirubrobacteraceae bacterium]
MSDTIAAGSTAGLVEDTTIFGGSHHGRQPVTLAGLMSVSAVTGLLERDAEIGSLDSLLRRVQAGCGGAIVIEGEAGIGKTALLEHGGASAAAAGMTVLRARGGELEREFPWGVVRQLFEPWLSRLERGHRSRLLAGSAALAGPLFDPGAGDRPAADDSFPALHGLYWTAVNAAREAPLLLSVDDLHWCDGPSLRFAAHLVTRLEGLPIMLLATVRPLGSESASDPALLAHLTTHRSAEQLRPSPLSERACLELVDARLEDGADPEFGRACHQMSRGNPFLLSALLDAWRAEHAHATAGDAERIRQMRPEAVSRSVLVRLATMGDGCQALAHAVAVLGARAEFRQARRLVALDTDTAVTAAAALSRAGIIRGTATLEFV